jgi:hypothetical protein
LFVTTAVESVDDAILEKLAKDHTRADFLRAIQLFRGLNLALNPTFVPFTPWTTLDGYRDLLTVLVEQGLVNHVAPIQLAIRLLVPAGSGLIPLMDLQPFDEAALAYPWRHPDPGVDALAVRVQEIVAASVQAKQSRGDAFRAIAHAVGLENLPPVFARTEVPYLNEPWYC